MTAVRREHMGAAAATTLVSQLTAGSTTFSITDATGWPTGSVGPFVVTIGAGTATEERILCLSRTTTTITVSSRGWEGTADQTHAAASAVVHTFSATEADEANIAAVAVAGITGALVGTTQTQTLTGKTVALGSNTVSGTKAQFQSAMTDADFATQDGTETLTNKTVALGSNTVSGTKAQFDAAVSDGDIAYRDGGSVTPQASTGGTWTTSSASGYWRVAGGICHVWGQLVRSSGGSESGATLAVYATTGPPAFPASLSGFAVGTFVLGGYGEGTLVAGTALADGFTAFDGNGNAYQPVFSGSAIARFHLSYPV